MADINAEQPRASSASTSWSGNSASISRNGKRDGSDTRHRRADDDPLSSTKSKGRPLQRFPPFRHSPDGDVSCTLVATGVPKLGVPSAFQENFCARVDRFMSQPPSAELFAL